MQILGKVVGFLFGSLLFGAPGGIFGLLIGHMFDKSYANFHPFTNRHRITQTYFTATFQVIGHIAKVDGRVSEAEIDAAKHVMQRMQLNAEQRQQAIHCFNQGKAADFDVAACISQLRKECPQTILLQMFIEVQFQAALADGKISPKKQHVLRMVCQGLGFDHLFSRFAHMFQQANYQSDYYQQQHSYRQRSYSQNQYQTSNDYSLQLCYDLLEITAKASNQEVKRAYRKLMSKNHPDKLIAQGLPEQMIKLATEKTQKIQKAYEQIKTARGF